MGAVSGLPASAAGFLQGGNLQQVAQGSGIPQVGASSLPDVVARIIGVVTSLLGLILLGYLIYAGYLWMTAGGDDKKVIEAKTMIKNAVIGLVLIALSYAISSFIITTLSSDVLQNGSGVGPGTPGSNP